MLNEFNYKVCELFVLELTLDKTARKKVKRSQFERDKNGNLVTYTRKSVYS